MSRNESKHDYPVYSMLGERHTILLDGEQTGGAYTVIEAFVQPGGGPPLHLHREQDETFIVLDGEFEFTVAGEKARVPAGGTVTVARGVPHKFTPLGMAPGRMVVTFRPAGLERFFAEAGTRLLGRDDAPIPTTPEQLERAIALLPGYATELVAEPA